MKASRLAGMEVCRVKDSSTEARHRTNSSNGEGKGEYP